MPADSIPHGRTPTPEVVVGEGSRFFSSSSFVHCRSLRRPALSIGKSSGVYHVRFDLGPRGEVRIGDYCAMQSCVICVDSIVQIDDYALIAYGAVLADDRFAVPGAGEMSADGVDPRPTTMSIRVGACAWIGTQATLLRGARIGSGAVVAARAVVDGEVPDNAIVAGNPARIVGWANV